MPDCFLMSCRAQQLYKAYTSYAQKHMKQTVLTDSAGWPETIGGQQKHAWTITFATIAHHIHFIGGNHGWYIIQAAVGKQHALLGMQAVVPTSEETPICITTTALVPNYSYFDHDANQTPKHTCSPNMGNGKLSVMLTFTYKLAVQRKNDCLECFALLAHTRPSGLVPACKTSANHHQPSSAAWSDRTL